MQQPSSTLLQVENLTMVFNIRQGFDTKHFTAVDEATFSLDSDKPEIFTIAGESGSGKTTLARMILGMERPTTGTLRYKNRDVARLSNRDKRDWFFREVQPVFQDPFATFSPLKRIDHYLYETLYNYKITDKAGAAAATVKTMETIVLPDVPELISPMVYALPVQLLAYYTAVFMGTDVDQPRNLAKSVTVE